MRTAEPGVSQLRMVASSLWETMAQSQPSFSQTSRLNSSKLCMPAGALAVPGGRR